MGSHLTVPMKLPEEAEEKLNDLKTEVNVQVYTRENVQQTPRSEVFLVQSAQISDVELSWGDYLCWRRPSFREEISVQHKG